MENPSVSLMTLFRNRSCSEKAKPLRGRGKMPRWSGVSAAAPMHAQNRRQLCRSLAVSAAKSDRKFFGSLFCLLRENTLPGNPFDGCGNRAVMLRPGGRPRLRSRRHVSGVLPQIAPSIADGTGSFPPGTPQADRIRVPGRCRQEN